MDNEERILELAQELLRLMGESMISKDERREIERKKRKAEEAAKKAAWGNLDINYRLRSRLESCGITSLAELTAYSRKELEVYGRRLTSEMIRKIVIALGKLGEHLRDEKVYEPSDEVTESPDVARDDAIIVRIMDELGYPRFDLFDHGQRWALEAIRFAMNNPKPATQYKMYLWPVIAKRDNTTVAEVTFFVGECVRNMNPTWKQIAADADENSESENELWRKVFKTGYGYVTDRTQFIIELRAIGVYAREVRRLEDIEIRRKNG